MDDVLKFPSFWQADAFDKGLPLPNIDVVSLLQDQHFRDQSIKGIGNLSNDLAQGASNELCHNSGNVAACFGTGLAAAGLAASLPEVAFVVGVVGAGVGAYQIYKHGNEWLHAASVVADPSKTQSKAEIEKAHRQVQCMGADSVDLVAGAAGGMCGSLLTSARMQALERASSKAFPELARAMDKAGRNAGEGASILIQRTPFKDTLKAVGSFVSQTYKVVQTSLETGGSLASATATGGGLARHAG